MRSASWTTPWRITNIPPAATSPLQAQLRDASLQSSIARDVLEDLPGRVVDEAQLRAMLAHLARTLHAGLLNDCFFDPGTALCLDTARDSNPAAPRLSQCAPDRCPNSCISVRHLPAWQAAIAQTEELLARKRLPPLQRIALNQERDRMRRLIAPLAKAGSG